MESINWVEILIQAGILVIALFALFLTLLKFGFSALNEVKKELKEDAQKAHGEIGNNINIFRTELNSFRSEVHKDINNLSTRMGRIEGRLGLLEEKE